jgi:hypothetical protein
VALFQLYVVHAGLVDKRLHWGGCCTALHCTALEVELDWSSVKHSLNRIFAIIESDGSEGIE